MGIGTKNRTEHVELEPTLGHAKPNPISPIVRPTKPKSNRTRTYRDDGYDLEIFAYVVWTLNSHTDKRD